MLLIGMRSSWCSCVTVMKHSCQISNQITEQQTFHSLFKHLDQKLNTFQLRPCFHQHQCDQCDQCDLLLLLLVDLIFLHLFKEQNTEETHFTATESVSESQEMKFHFQRLSRLDGTKLCVCFIITVNKYIKKCVSGYHGNTCWDVS